MMFDSDGFVIMFWINLLALLLGSYLFLKVSSKTTTLQTKLRQINLTGKIASIGLLLQSLCWLVSACFLMQQQDLSWVQTVSLAITTLPENVMCVLPLLILMVFTAIYHKRLKQKQFDTEAPQATSGNFGSADWVSEIDLKNIDAFNANDTDNKIPIGQDETGKVLYLPLLNKLTLSPQGGGKSTASSIPALLSYNGPMFVFDVKGELWVTTARYRAETFKRKIVVIDPFRITKGQDFIRNKPATLLKDYYFNPFDWIPENQKERDRMINAFASSFIIHEGGNGNAGGNAVHFDENAKILIRGYCEYMMHQLPKEKRNLITLYTLLCEQSEDAKLTFEQMSQVPGRAAAAANQINRVGADERGSILSTSYRQIDWMSDSNIQETLSSSNFNLNDFLKGDMDIFVVIPEDQVKEHSRLVRMILVLLKAAIVRANPSDLPKKKMLFLLEELAQLGYCPDVEECIETLRARGIVIWGIFQTLSQIECYKKPDLFKTMPIKQIFTNDDEKTMEWVQKLGGKKTIITKTLSSNSGDSKQKMQFVGGTTSQGEGESVHETGVDLIPTNQIRELSMDEQFVFYMGAKPIRCKKIRYFEHPLFAGRYDINFLEVQSFIN